MASAVAVIHMSAYTHHIEKSQVAFLERHSAVKSNPPIALLVSHLRNPTISYEELDQITKHASSTRDPTLIEAALNLSITIASAGHWTTWAALRASGHEPAFDRNFGFQDFMARHWRRQT